LKQAAAAPALRQPEAPRLVMDIPPGLPLVSGGPDDLSEAFAQIIDNAIRYTPASGVVLISAQADGETVTVTVEDTGIGIPDEALPRVFDLFFRLDAAHSTRGFGLGLSIARLIIERCGGHIAVESKAGSGTQVRVALPVYHG
jgi:signal transduction histidine kinase